MDSTPTGGEDRVITLGPDEHLTEAEFDAVLARAGELGFGRGGTRGCILTPETIRAIRDDLGPTPDPST